MALIEGSDKEIRDIISENKTRISKLIEGLDKKIKYLNQLNAPLSNDVYDYDTWFMVSEDYKTAIGEGINKISRIEEELDELKSSFDNFNNKIDEVSRLYNAKTRIEFGIQGIARGQVPVNQEMFETERFVYDLPLASVPFNRENIGGGRKSKRHKKKRSRKSRKNRK